MHYIIHKVNFLKLMKYLLLFTGVIVSLLPIVWMLLSSFKTMQEITAVPPTLFPRTPTFQNYREVWNRVDFSTYFKNSTILVVVKTLIILYTSAVAGYVLAKLRFKGRNPLYIFILATQMIPWPVTILTLYQEMFWFQWIDTYKALIIPSVFSSFGIFMMRQYMLGLPDSLMESARIDGANELTVVHRIVMPLLGPPLSALGIFIMLWVWDDFLWPLLMLNSKELFTIPIGLSIYKGMYYTEYDKQLAGISIAVLPVIAAYMVLQRRFIEGIAFTGLKG